LSEYGAPPPPSPGYYPTTMGGTPPPNHLVWAILSTVLCCLPLGVVSIVFAAQVNSKWQAGDLAGAADASAKARNFAMWSAIAGVAGAVIWILAVVVLGTLGSSS